MLRRDYSQIDESETEPEPETLVSAPPVDTDDKETCSICFENIEDEDNQTLECDHSFHKDCIYVWSLRNNTCPNCRRPSQILVDMRSTPQISPQRMAVIRRGISRFTRNQCVRSCERSLCALGTGAACATGGYMIGAHGIPAAVTGVAPHPLDGPCCGFLGGLTGCISASENGREHRNCSNCCTESCDRMCGERRTADDTLHDTEREHDMERGALKNKYKKGKRGKRKSKRKKSKRKSKRKYKKRKTKKKSKL